MAEPRDSAARTPVPADEPDWLTLGQAAKYLGMTPKELRTARQSGRSLAQIAASKGKSVDGLVAAIVAPAKARAAKAVSNGKLTQQRADELIARLTERVKALVERVPATS